MTPVPDNPIDPALHRKLARLGDEGWEMWARFDREVRSQQWHPFVPAEYDRVMLALTALRQPGLRFLEFGSATGIVTVMADLLGYEACGIELDECLVTLARATAARYASRARFAAGSFLPQGYVWRSRDSDKRLGTVGEGVSGYRELGMPLDDFDLVFAYPWRGEEAMMLDLLHSRGDPDAGLLLQRVSGEVQLFRKGRLERSWGYSRDAERNAP